MAFYDWNHNGEDDMMDDFIEYQIYRETMEKNDYNDYSSSSEGCSTFVAFLITISGLIIQSVFYTALEIDVDNVPVFIMILLWIVIDVVVAVVMDKLGVL